jgi:hypothetical protein
VLTVVSSINQSRPGLVLTGLIFFCKQQNVSLPFAAPLNAALATGNLQLGFAGGGLSFVAAVLPAPMCNFFFVLQGCSIIKRGVIPFGKMIKLRDAAETNGVVPQPVLPDRGHLNAGMICAPHSCSALAWRSKVVERWYYAVTSAAAYLLPHLPCGCSLVDHPVKAPRARRAR